MYAPLLTEERGNTFDLARYGYICIVDENSNVLYSAGDPDDFVFYRSASKPIQSLPVFQLGLNKKFGITEEEAVVLSASHAGMSCHVNAVESILKKAGLSEDMLIMNPACPADEKSNEERILKGIPKRKVFHNCSGKHCALMMVQRELGGDVNDYWKVGSLVHNRVEDTIKTMSETNEVKIGIDGCGVPVFAVGIKNIAIAFKNLACPDTIKDDSLREAACENVERIMKYPHMIRGEGFMCTIMNKDPNIIAKGGANGVYGFGLKKQRLGVSFKLVDGTESAWPFIAIQILSALGALTDEHRERLEALHPTYFINDNGIVVGERKSLVKISL